MERPPSRLVKRALPNASQAELDAAQDELYEFFTIIYSIGERIERDEKMARDKTSECGTVWEQSKEA